MGIHESAGFDAELDGFDAIEADRKRRARVFSVLIGLLAGLLLASGTLAWRWPMIGNLPWVMATTDLLFHTKLPRAQEGKYSIALAHLDGDAKDHRAESLLRNELAAFGDIAVLPIDRKIIDDERAQLRTQKLADAVGADALVWGSVDTRKGGGNSVHLHWAPNARLALAKSNSAWASDADNFSLPPVALDDLTPVFDLLVLTRHAESLTGLAGPEISAMLDSGIQAARQWLQDDSRHPDAMARASVQALLAEALVMSADLSGNDAALEESAAIYRALPDAELRAHSPMEWARAQNNLGFALARLGEYEMDTQKIEASVSALQNALQERTPDKTPLDWAASQYNLGVALTMLGQRDADARNLEAAVAAFHAALQQWTSDGAPLKWATAQNNLGIALALLHERKPGGTSLSEAAAAFQAALHVWTLENEPLSWALAQNRLGLATDKLSDHDSAQQALNEAVSALRAALQDHTLDALPQKKAMIQYNLGLALAALGAHDSGTQRLEAATDMFRAAQQGWTRDTAPYAWATAQNDLGLALTVLAAHGGGAQRYDEAAAAFRAALQEWTRERIPYRWAMAQNNLGFALLGSSAQTAGAGQVNAALAAFRAALQEWTRDNALDEWAAAQNNLGLALEQLGGLETGTQHLSQAVAAYTVAKTAMQPGDDPFLYSRITGNFDRSRNELERRRALATVSAR